MPPKTKVKYTPNTRARMQQAADTLRENLIEEVRTHECLHNRRHEGYKDAGLKKQTWLLIAVQVKCKFQCFPLRHYANYYLCVCFFWGPVHTITSTHVLNLFQAQPTPACPSGPP